MRVSKCLSCHNSLWFEVQILCGDGPLAFPADSVKEAATFSVMEIEISLKMKIEISSSLEMIDLSHPTVVYVN